MSGRVFEKQIKAVAKPPQQIQVSVPQKMVSEPDKLDSAIKKRLWRLNNLMFLFQLYF